MNAKPVNKHTFVTYSETANGEILISFSEIVRVFRIILIFCWLQTSQY